MRRFAVVFLLLLAGISTGVSAAEKTGTCNSAISAQTGGEDFGPAYVIGPGDVLGIEVWKDPVLTRQVVVPPDGKISIPLIGEIAAGGMTVSGLKKEVETRLFRYVPDAVVTVEVRSINSMHIYVLGRINSPGRIVLVSNVNVLQALAIAGGPNPYANRSRIRVFRNEGGKTLTYNFDYDDVTSGRQLETNITVRRGDVIYVP